MQCHIKVLLLYIFPTYIWSMTKLKYDVTVEGSNLLPLISSLLDQFCGHEDHTKQADCFLELPCFIQPIKKQL